MIRQNDADYKSHEDVPMLFSNATNWKGRPFVRLADYIEMSSESPKFLRQATEIAKETLEFKDIDALPLEKR